MSRSSFTVRLGEKDHLAWYKLAEELDQRPATLAAIVLKDLLAQRQQSFNNVVYLKRDPFQTKVSTNLSSSEMDLLDEFADHLGVSRSKAIVALIKGVINQQPIFDNETKQLLAESNHLLKMVSINVNQIAHVLNSYEAGIRNGTPSPLDVFAIEKSCQELMKAFDGKDLKKFIADHVSCIQSLIRANTLKPYSKKQ